MDDSQYFYAAFGLSRKSFSSKLFQAIALRNSSFGHPTLETARTYSLARMESDISLLRELTSGLSQQPTNKWIPNDAGMEPVRDYFSRIEREVKERFGTSPISLTELGQAVFGTDILSEEQENSVEQAVEFTEKPVRGGNVLEVYKKEAYIEKIASVIAMLRIGPVSETQAQALLNQDGKSSNQKEEALKTLEEMKEAPAEDFMLSCPKLSFKSSQAFRNVNTPIPLTQVQDSILSDFILLVDESVFLCESGRLFLSQLRSVISKKKDKLYLDESVTAAIFRQFRQSKPYTALELEGVDQTSAKELQRDRARLHTEAKTAIKLLNQFREHGLLQIVSSPTSSNYSYDNIEYLIRTHQGQRFFVLTRDGKLAADLRNCNAVVAKPTQVQGELWIFQSSWAALNQMRVEKDNTLLSTDPTPAQEKVHESEQEELLPIKALPRSGHIVIAQQPDGTSKHTIRLGSFLAEGGEGAIYNTSDSSSVAKIYFQQRLTRSRKEKLSHMVAANPRIKGLRWPTELLYTAEGEWVGFLMPKANGLELATTVFTPGRENRNLTVLGWTRKDIVLIAANIAETFRKIHAQNLLMGDINPRNFMVEPESRSVYFVDCDSYQFDGFPCPVFSDLFLPAEVHKKAQLNGGKYTSFVRTKENELYSLAVLLFQTLMLGKAPFESRSTNNDDLVQAIIDGDFPYRFNENSDNDSDDTPVNRNPRSKMRPPVGQWRFIWSHLPHKIKKNFYYTFTGKGRPTAAQWENDLRVYYRSIMEGDASDELSPTTHKVVAKSADQEAVEMVDLVCKRCNQPFNLDINVYNKRQNTPIQGLCETCIAKRSNFRKRKKKPLFAVCAILHLKILFNIGSI